MTSPKRSNQAPPGGRGLREPEIVRKRSRAIDFRSARRAQINNVGQHRQLVAVARPVSHEFLTLLE